MITQYVEALKLAEKWFKENAYNDEAVKVHQVIKKSLEQPSRKPTAYLYISRRTPFMQYLEFKNDEILFYHKDDYARLPLFLGSISDEERPEVRLAAMHTGQN